MSVAFAEIKDEDARIRQMLTDTTTIAVVGASSNPLRASNYVMAYMQSRGYRTIPVNPMEVGRTIHGEAVYEKLADVPPPVDLVDVFRNSDAVGDLVEEVIAEKDRLRIKGIWLQQGVHNDAAAHRATVEGLGVIQDRCVKIEYGIRFGATDRSKIRA
jgi:predicted CoA-binding protein